MKKIKVMTISDMPIANSGVANQTRYMIDALVKTGEFEFVCLGGAIRHPNYAPMKVEEWGDDVIIYPVDAYGNEDVVRFLLRQEKPDMLWIMTDPRFYEWLWEIDNEIRQLVPLVYYHVWDNDPPPVFNKTSYMSNDVIATISKLTDRVVNTVTPTVETKYIPHGCDLSIFKTFPEPHRNNVRSRLGKNKDKFVVFWNNRNARRKQSGTLVHWFKDFLDIVGHDKATLIMHTNPLDENGQNLEYIGQHLGLTNEQFIISNRQVPPHGIAELNNMADVVVNISDAEGFGLNVLEALACGTPVVATATGGIVDQMTDGKEVFGVLIQPSARSVIGTQVVPFIYEDRISKEDFLDAMMKIYNMSREERKEVGKKARKHVEDNFSLEGYVSEWYSLLKRVHDEHGSWDTRKKYKPWSLTEVSK